MLSRWGAPAGVECRRSDWGEVSGNINTYMESRKMVLMSLFAGQQWRRIVAKPCPTLCNPKYINYKYYLQHWVDVHFLHGTFL